MSEKKLFDQFCLYYQARIKKEYVWFVVAGLKGFEHVAFDRCINPKESVFEFFVAPHCEDVFLEVMNWFEKRTLVSCLEKKENRLSFESIL